MLVEVAHGAVGHDQNGRTLHADVTDWFAENDINDPGMRDAFRRLFRAIEAETARVSWEQIQEKKQQARG